MSFNKKEWAKKYNKEYYHANREREIKRAKEYFSRPEVVERMKTEPYRARKNASQKKCDSANKEKRSAYDKANRKRKNIYLKNRKESDIQYRLSCGLRSRMHTALRLGYKGGSAVRDLGCSLEEFKKYIENKFEKGMTWKNNTRDGWHIDHIIQLASFDLSDRDQFLKAAHYTNMRPLWAAENYSRPKKRLDTSLVFSQQS